MSLDDMWDRYDRQRAMSRRRRGWPPTMHEDSEGPFSQRVPRLQLFHRLLMVGCKPTSWCYSEAHKFVSPCWEFIAKLSGPNSHETPLAYFHVAVLARDHLLVWYPGSFDCIPYDWLMPVRLPVDNVPHVVYRPPDPGSPTPNRTLLSHSRLISTAPFYLIERALYSGWGWVVDWTTSLWAFGVHPDDLGAQDVDISQALARIDEIPDLIMERYDE